MVDVHKDRSIEENYMLLNFQDFLAIYYSKISEDWKEVSGYIEQVFDINDLKDYTNIIEKIGITFNLDIIKESYQLQKKRGESRNKQDA